MLTFQERTEKLIETKNLQTAEKLNKFGRTGHFDTDDKGLVLPPEDFNWQPVPNHPSGGFFGAKAVGENFASLLKVHPTYIDPYSSLAGAFMFHFAYIRNPGWNPDIKIPEELSLKHHLYNLVSGIGGAHHFHHDAEHIGMKIGFGGILDKIRHYMEVYKDDPKKYDFLYGEHEVILGIQNWILRNAQAAEKAAKTEILPELRLNLENMAKMNYKLVNSPPETFQEACQWLTWFLLQAVMFNGSGAGGALDSMLKPYFDRDIKNGILTEEEAVFHLSCLLLKDNQYYEIGGRNPDGSDRTNRLSYCILEAAHLLKIPNAITLRIHEDIDREFVKTAVKYLFNDKHGSPAFLGDRAMVEGFMKNGYSAEEARTRVKVGCHWCALPGTEYTLNDVVKINFAKVFEVSFWEMINDKTEAFSIKRLWELFKKHLMTAARAIADSIDFHVENMWKVVPEMALNFMCHGPIERGLDISDGGVDNYNFCVDGAALGTVADCFGSLYERVEKEGKISWDELASHLKNNWEGYENIRMMMKNTPRYGSGGSTADLYAVKIVEYFNHCVKNKPTSKGYNMIPGLFSWANTIPMGRAVNATPNGRLAGSPITHGANPEPGFKESGALTAIGLAVAGIQPGWGNTAPLQLEIDPILGIDETGVLNITEFLMTYCTDLGGTLVNINILDKDKILDAHAHPERHPELVVRVTGFSAYFSNLSKDFRQLVVDRIIAG